MCKSEDHYLYALLTKVTLLHKPDTCTMRRDNEGDRGKGFTISEKRMGTHESIRDTTNTPDKCQTINSFVYPEKKYLCILLLEQYERSNMIMNQIFIYHHTNCSP